MELELADQELRCGLCRDRQPHARTPLPERDAVLLRCRACGLEAYRWVAHLARADEEPYCGRPQAQNALPEVAEVECPDCLALAAVELAPRARPDWRPGQAIPEDFYACLE